MKNSNKKQFNWNILSEIVGILLCVIGIPLIVLNITAFIKGLANPNGVATVFSRFEVIEANNLMKGSKTSIKEGDLLFFKSGVSDYNVGAEDGSIVAVMTDNNNVIVRRLISSSTAADGTVTYVADADNPQDFTRVEITADEIAGVYSGRIAGLGTLIIFSHRPLGTFLFAVVPLIILFLTLYFTARRNNADVRSTTSAVIPARQGETVIAEYDVYIDENGKQVVKRVKK